jgi:hypothetical protein
MKFAVGKFKENPDKGYSARMIAEIKSLKTLAVQTLQSDLGNSLAAAFNDYLPTEIG